MCTNECQICGSSGHNHWYNEEERIQSFGPVTGDVNSCKYCGQQIFLEGNLGRQLVLERTTQPSPTPFKMACLLHERVLKGLGEAPIGFRMSHDGDSTDGEYGRLHDYEKWIAAFPKAPLEHIDRALLNIYRHISRAEGLFTGHFEVEIDNGDPFCCRALFCAPHQTADLLGMMKNMEYVDWHESVRAIRRVSLKPKGLQRIAELQASQTDTSDTCFVAMAYHENTDAYRGAVRLAVERAGYRADVITVDEDEHNNFIMDRVINMIDDARFVIADLTVLPEKPPEHAENKVEKPGKAKNGVRGGVYWEAGYARGRGKEVIYTFNGDDHVSENRIHFDIEQIVRIKWTNNDLETLTNNLTSRIIATVGKGPRYRE